MKGRLRGAVFIFLSGLGSGSADLAPVASAINNEGHTCELLQLPINVTADSEWRSIEPTAIIAQIDAAVSPHVAAGNKVYLVGFSLGATFAMLYAADHRCDGILALSAFLKPYHDRLSRLMFWYRRWTCRPYLDRIPQVTVPETVKQLDLSSRLPIDVVEAAIAIGQIASTRIGEVTCPVLFIHSFDDRVADYAAVAGVLRRCGADRSRMISFHHLNHYLQFDMPPGKLARFALHYFGLPPGPGTASVNLGSLDQTKAIADVLKLYTEERRHWTLLMFNAIAGFFTVFAGLLYFTLGDVVADTPKAPYYLLSYSIATSIYLTVAILYFFYANRVDAYIKFFVDPLMHGVTWAAFRTSKWMAGRESFWTTSLATIPLAVIPTLLSLGSLGACIIGSWDKLISAGLDYVVLKLLFLAATFLFVYTVYAIISHNRFTRRWLFSAHPADKSDFETETLLFALYQSVSPGCVSQPRRQIAGGTRGNP
jgi:pimeloyl-ACP methyl ester carboxylesterase